MTRLHTKPPYYGKERESQVQNHDPTRWNKGLWSINARKQNWLLIKELETCVWPGFQNCCVSVTFVPTISDSLPFLNIYLCLNHLSYAYPAYPTSVYWMCRRQVTFNSYVLKLRGTVSEMCPRRLA